MFEPRRDCWRSHFLGGWGHDDRDDGKAFTKGQRVLPVAFQIKQVTSDLTAEAQRLNEQNASVSETQIAGF